MALRTIYANLADGLQPFSLWDQSLADMGSLGIIPCTAVGTNSIVLTPIASVFAPNVTVPQALQAFSFVAVANSTGVVTIQVGTSAALKLYRMDGVTQASTGDLTSTVTYFINYNAALNSSAGGFQILAPLATTTILPFTQPTSYPSSISFGHVVPYLDSDAQFGNAYSQYPLGVVSSNPLIIGKSGSTIGSSTNGQTFKIVFTSTGLTGSPITKTYTAGAAETTTTIAAGLAALVNADPILHGLGGKPIFMQSLGAGVFNLQYDAAFSATGATPLTTATTGSTGTITLAGEQNNVDFIVFQLGRNIPGRNAINGDTMFAFDFTGQDSTGSFNTHYGQISVTAKTATAGAVQGLINFNTPLASGAIVGRMGIGQGVYLYDSTGALPTGGDTGSGTINVPTAYFVAGGTLANTSALYTPGGNLFGGTAAGSTLNLQSTQSGAPSGDFVQVKGSVITLRNIGSGTSDIRLGVSGATGATITIAGGTSGSQIWTPAAIASGTATMFAGTDTVIGKATTDVLTNKTFNSTGTGNVLQVSGVTVSSGQYPGEPTTGSATAGNVGEFVSATVLVGAAVSITNGTATNITSISLTAGDWDVAGNIVFLPAGTTTWNSAAAWTSTTTAAFPTLPNNGAITRIQAPMTTGQDQTLTIGTQRISISGTTTVFLSALAGFGTSTMTGYGFIRARRVR